MLFPSNKHAKRAFARTHARTPPHSKQNLQIYRTDRGTPFGILADALRSADVRLPETESRSSHTNLRKIREAGGGGLYKKRPGS